MNKVYCKNCKHHSNNYFTCGCCMIKPYYKSNWFERSLCYVDCETRNRHNDCKYFDKEEPKPEKILESTPEIKKKRGFRYYLSKI